MMRIGRLESLGGYGHRKVLEVKKVKGFERLGRSNIFRGQGARQIWEVREVGKFVWAAGSSRR
jgi:hypothetical protein